MSLDHKESPPDHMRKPNILEALLAVDTEADEKHVRFDVGDVS